MEIAPPTYDEAVELSVLPLVAKYLSPAELCSAALVSREWNKHSMPALWRRPRFSTSIHEDSAYDALARFKTSIYIARAHVRELTCILEVPYELEDIYQGVPSKWLRQLADLLPNLQALVVSRVNLLDHAALIALQGLNDSPGTTSVRAYADHLRLLDASYCENATARGLIAAFPSFPNLLYLDLSGVKAAGDAKVLDELKAMKLTVLKLCNVQLKDDAFATVCKAVGRHLCSLDVTSNMLTDQSITPLFNSCLVTRDEHDILQVTGHTEQQSRATRPRYLKRLPNTNVTVDLVPGVDDLVKATLMQAPVSITQPEESIPQLGLRTLRIAQNEISIRASARLLECVNLQTLDLSRSRQPSQLSRDLAVSPLMMAISNFTNLDTFSATNMEILRIDFTSLFNDSPPYSVLSPPTSQAVSSPSNIAPGNDQPNLLPMNSTDTLSEIKKIREDRRSKRFETRHQTVPLNCPRLHTLVISNIPATATSRNPSTQLIELIKECATEAELAGKQARHDYTLPPHLRHKPSAIKIHALSLFPLETLVLEIKPPNIPKSTRSGWYDDMAVTGRRESRAFQDASSSDFSFFDGSWRDSGTKPRPIAPASGDSVDSSTKEDPGFDFVAEISAFRRRAKADAARAAGLKEPMASSSVHGFWMGKVTVVRDSSVS